MSGSELNFAGGTSTEVRSPTSTSTATRAYTSGNVTVTGGAGTGNTTVNINPRQNESSSSLRAALRRTLRAGGDPEIDRLVDVLTDERDRINRERLALEAGTFSGLGFLGVGELQTRADSMLALLQAIDRHVGEVLPRLEERARNGEAGARQKAIESTSRIINAVGGVSPLSDALDDTKKLVNDIVDDAHGAANIGLMIAAAAAVTAVVVKLFF